ncbi:DNA excision repair protein ERCC-1 isoform X2 [Syngnathus acus]|uniref:DNA excision repair protein ERCC-1 isoform X2 n=1 Tax=Syngnathus acus TaxID=161584 RepID=UPI001885BD1A|nr:DNA excision repair protein ERCC-1 isoform X2 [Syngnathus acus]
MKKRFNIDLDDSAFTKERTPPKPHFQPSVTAGQSKSNASASPGKETQPLSYAQYIIKAKAQGSAVPQPDPLPPVVGPSGGDEVTKNEETLGSGPSGQREINCPSLGPKPAGSGSSIIVSSRQRGNPILKFVRSVPWEFGEVVPDYVLGQTTCALFLSLRYHNLNPNYIHERLKQLGQSFTLRVLLVQVDVKDPHHALKELARICIMADCTLILAWSPEEAGRYLETYKSYEKKPADLLKEQVEKNYLSKVTDCLTTVKSINKTDAMTLLSTFSSLEGIISASKEDLVLCPGLGPQKARRLYDVLHKPFLKSKTKSNS